MIVGGTGLYFKALLEGLSPVPDIPEAIRGDGGRRRAAMDSAALHGILRQRDPAMAARLLPSDPQRIVRALEVLDATGRSLLDWQQVPGEPCSREAEAELLFVSPAARDALCPMRCAAGPDDRGRRAGGGQAAVRRCGSIRGCRRCARSA